MAKGNDERHNENRKVGREYFASTRYTVNHPKYGRITQDEENEYYTEDDLPKDWHKLSSEDKEHWLNNTAKGGTEGRTFPVPTAWTRGWAGVNYPKGVKEDSPEAEEIDDWLNETEAMSMAPYKTTMHERHPDGGWVKMKDPTKGKKRK